LRFEVGKKNLIIILNRAFVPIISSSSLLSCISFNANSENLALHQDNIPQREFDDLFRIRFTCLFDRALIYKSKYIVLN